MTWYKVIGTSRQVESIGAFQPFAHEIQTDTAKMAYDAVRAQMYADNREHVHVKEIKVWKNEGQGQEWEWMSVDPAAWALFTS